MNNKELVEHVIETEGQKYVDKSLVKSRDLKEYYNVLTDEEADFIMKDITDRERKCLEWEHEGGHLSEFGEKYNLTRERARQINEAAKFKVIQRIFADIRTIGDFDSFVKDKWREVNSIISEKASGKEISEKTRISYPTISGIRKGTIEMSAMDVYVITKCLGVSTKEVIGKEIVTPLEIGMGV